MNLDPHTLLAGFAALAVLSAIFAGLAAIDARYVTRKEWDENNKARTVLWESVDRRLERIERALVGPPPKD